MCGRFVLLTDLSQIVRAFGIDEIACDYRPRDNISPGQEVAAVIHDGRNRLVGYRWGLVPAWAKDPSIGKKMFNARAETVAGKPSFRDAFQKRRCLIPADGFYEWQRSEKGKKPFRISLKTGEPFAFAGLYETWISPEKRCIHSCTIITTEPNELLRPIHDRMPAIVRKGREALWLAPGRRDSRELLSLLSPYPAGEMALSEATLPITAAHRAGYTAG